MNQRSDTDRLLRHWLADGPSTMPDRVVDVVADRINRQPQRRNWRLRGRLSMNGYLKLAASLAAVLVVAVVGYNLLPRTGIGGPGPSQTPVPTVAPTLLATSVPTQNPCDDGTSGCLGLLEPGSTYSSSNFRPALTYTIPPGSGLYTNSIDLSRAYTIVPPGGGYSFQVLSEVAIPEQTQPDCTTKQLAGVGNAVADWVNFLTKHPGLDAKAPVPVTVGGFSGFRIDFARAASWTALCPGSVGPAILTVMHPGHEGVLWIDDQQESFWLLDVGGETVIVHLDSSPSALQHESDVLSAQPIIDSFRFTPR